MQSSPNVSAVLIETTVFDEEQSSFLIVRVPAAGEGAVVEAPQYVPDPTGLATVATVRVTRSNPPDALRAILPKLNTMAKQQRFREKLELSRRYGQHMTYQVLNSAYQAMAPQEEGWTVRIMVNSPFHFGDIENVTVVTSSGARDSLMIFPLEREQPEALQKKPRILREEDEEDNAAEGQ